MDNMPRKRVWEDIKTMLLFILVIVICGAIVLVGALLFGSLPGVAFVQDNPYPVPLNYHDHRL